LKQRLKRKNAPGERAISDKYIEQVAAAYEHFFFHYSASDLLVVDTNEIDFVNNNRDLQALLKRLSEPVRGTQYFLPLG
jgi:deoxyguanosine kinase